MLDCIFALTLSYLPFDDLFKILKSEIKYHDIIKKFLNFEFVVKCPKSICNDDLKYLTGVHTIDLSYCQEISDNGVKYLTGVSKIYHDGCGKITKSTTTTTTTTL